MANLSKCKRCGRDIVTFRPHATNQRFCGVDCRDTWWNELRGRSVTRGAWAERRYGVIEKRDLPIEVRSWLAALIDGEGTISIWKERRPGNRSGVRYKAVVAIYNTNVALLDQAKQFLDGYVAIGTLPTYKSHAHHKPCYKVMVNRRAIPYVLEQVMPYLRAKVKQAEFVLEFYRVLNTAPIRTSDDHGVLEELRREVQMLNKRGR